MRNEINKNQLETRYNKTQNIGIKADIISLYYSFNSFWSAIGENEPLWKINQLWNEFLYMETDVPLSERFEYFNLTRTENKINPDTDNIETALIKVGMSPKVAKAIVSGYEGIFPTRPISDSLNYKCFYGRDLLHKARLVFMHKYPAWDKDLLSASCSSNKRKIETLLAFVIKEKKND